MSVFRDRWVKRQPALDRAFGERLEIRHMIDGQFVAGRSDPRAPVFIACGILDLPDHVVVPAGVSDGAKSDMVVTDPVVDFDRAQFGVGRLEPRKGTILVAIDRPRRIDGQFPKFRVKDALLDGVARLTCQLALADQPGMPL